MAEKQKATTSSQTPYLYYAEIKFQVEKLRAPKFPMTEGRVEGPRGAARLLDIHPRTLQHRMNKGVKGRPLCSPLLLYNQAFESVRPQDPYLPVPGIYYQGVEIRPPDEAFSRIVKRNLKFHAIQIHTGDGKTEIFIKGNMIRADWKRGIGG